jgi:hypothetical protein
MSHLPIFPSYPSLSDPPHMNPYNTASTHPLFRFWAVELNRTNSVSQGLLLCAVHGLLLVGIFSCFM